jgi:hypothetical protein
MFGKRIYVPVRAAAPLCKDCAGRRSLRWAANFRDFGDKREIREIGRGKDCWLLCKESRLPVKVWMISYRGWNDNQGVRSHVDDP